PAPRAIGEAQLETALVGQELFRGGAKQYAVPACMACHGPDGHGVPVKYPRVAGQWPEYLESQLLAFKSGERADPVMGPIAFRLSATQIRALALYMSGLQ
ncbi:MAG TPA: c-type cytochrome, partial [Arenicellales bacterium]|nr:c-type cytochrome [Arenicellales bacterium]